MSNWIGKYVIGLTGNIATGKSVVRRMLEHLGAYTIDADALAHRAIAKGAPGYGSVIENFGKIVLDAEGEIDRKKLGRIVFNDPQAMAVLESIVHPFIRQAVDILVKRSSQSVVVIEAIKLLEGELAAVCDVIWVTNASLELQEQRLVRKRAMSPEEARQRIAAQASQQQKLDAAHVVIQNTASFEDTWKQVVAAWKVIAPAAEPAPVVEAVPAGEFFAQRGKPRDSSDIAALISRLTAGVFSPSAEDIMANFGEMAYLLLRLGPELVGLAGWQVENLVARTTQIYLSPKIDTALALKTLITELEKDSCELQCEASLIFLLPSLGSNEDMWKELGYNRRTVQSLGVQAWQDAALESQPPDTVLFFKQLRQDRVLRPI